MKKNIYGYARVSSADQNLDRQIEMLKTYVEDESYIFCDKASGKDFNRKEYNGLAGTPETAPRLREGDLLVVTSLDRLGRNYGEIREQWEHITKKIKADIKVLDMPLLDTSQQSDSLDRRFIADLVLQILSYTAEKERINIRARQRQGIDAAQSKGVRFGRPKAEYPANWDMVYSQWKDKKITALEAMQQLKLKRTTFYKLVKEAEGNI